MKSMTGYGSSDIAGALVAGTVTLRSWNNRYLELSVQMPAFLAALERPAREYVESRVARGKLELSVRARSVSNRAGPTIDEAGARTAADALRKLARAAGIDEPVGLSHLMAVEGVLSFERGDDAEALWSDLEPALEACMRSYEAERLREGAAARADMEGGLAAIERSLDVVEARAPELESFVKTDLRRRFMEVMGDLVDEARILSEVSAYLARHTINEELSRLRSHAASFLSSMDEPACGKKLDFICQELNREANTIGSKSAQAEVSAAVIAMKEAIENLREQARNVE